MSEENWAGESQGDDAAASQTTAEEGAAELAVEAVAVERSGHADVDAVLDSLGALEGTPVAEQVAVFEAAHDKLRAALADAGNDPSA